MPTIPDPTVASEDVFGTCYDILNRTHFEYDMVVDEFPDPNTLTLKEQWSQLTGRQVDDDFVANDGYKVKQDESERVLAHAGYWIIMIIVVTACIVLGIRNHWRRDRKGYDQLV